jgi:amino acid transporter
VQLTSIAGISFFAAGLIQALIILNNPNYVPQPYHGTLLVIAVAGFSMLFNTFLAKKLPLVEGIMLVIHVCGFFAIILPLWILGPRANASDVFTTFTNGGGWNSVGTSTLVGMLTTVIALTGSDSAVHMCMFSLVFYWRKLIPVRLIPYRSRRDKRCGPYSSPIFNVGFGG